MDIIVANIAVQREGVTKKLNQIYTDSSQSDVDNEIQVEEREFGMIVGTTE